LARDLARSAGSAAHLTALRRHAAGAFHLGQAVPVERLREGGARLAPAIDALVGHPVQPLTAAEIGQVTRGIDVEARVDGAVAALLDPAAPTTATSLVALGERRPSERGDRWQPRVVLRDR
jgi:tRNA pseudouridine55 synthase